MVRKVQFANGEYYHIYNRGVDKRNIVLDREDADRFVQGLSEFNTTEPIGSIYENSFLKSTNLRIKPLVNIVCYCLNPNHFHMILEQVVDGGISLFMSKQAGGYAKYFNNKHRRTGTLLQGPFKAKLIDSNNYLLHSSVYVNLNNKVHQLGTLGSKLIRSSLGEYSGIYSPGICKKDMILDQFSSGEEYAKFCADELPEMIARRAMYKELQSLFNE